MMLLMYMGDNFSQFVFRGKDQVDLCRPDEILGPYAGGFDATAKDG